MLPRPLQHPGVGRRARRAAVLQARRDSEEMRYLRERRAALGGFLPARRRTAPPLAVPPLEAFGSRARRHRRARDLHHHGVRAPAHGAAEGQEHRQEHRADRAGRGAHLRHGGPVPPDRHLLLGRPAVHAAGRRDRSCPTARTRRARCSRRASTRRARCARGSRPAPPTANHGVNMVPFYIFYSMFGFQRVGDFIWAAGDIQARGFLLGATAGPHDARRRRPAAPGRPQPAASRRRCRTASPTIRPSPTSSP